MLFRIIVLISYRAPRGLITKEVGKKIGVMDKMMGVMEEMMPHMVVHYFSKMNGEDAGCKVGMTMVSRREGGIVRGRALASLALLLILRSF